MTNGTNMGKSILNICLICISVDVHSESERRSGCRSDNTTTTTTTDCNGKDLWSRHKTTSLNLLPSFLIANRKRKM